MSVLDTAAEIMVDVACAVMECFMFGNYSQYESAYDRYTALMTGAAAASSGAVDELEYYGGES